MAHDKGGKQRPPEDVERGFAALLKFGDAEKAAAETGIPATTLRTWRQKHPDRFVAVRREHARALEEMRASLAEKAWRGVGASIGVLASVMADGEPRDKVAATRAMASIADLLDTKGRLDSDMPTEIVEQRDTRTDGELIADIETALADPKLRAAFERERVRASKAKS